MAFSGKAADLVSDGGAGGFQWIEYRYSMDYVLVGFSFDNPMEAGRTLTWLEFDRDSAKIPTVRLCPGLPGLNSSAAGYLSAGMLRGGPRLSCYGKNPPGGGSAIFDVSGQLKELRISGTCESLDGLGALTGVEKLTHSCSDLTDIKALGRHEGVKWLTLEYCNELKRFFRKLSVMDWLEGLSIESGGHMDVGFVQNMPKLTSFSCLGAKSWNLDSLKGYKLQLPLSITKCGELKDMSAVSGAYRT